MELCPVPRRLPRGGRRRVLGVGLLAVLGLLFLVPAVLGLDRSVAGSDAAGDDVGPGSLLIARDVPAGDLRVGDLITFHPPGQPGVVTVTHRIATVGDGMMTTSATSATSATSGSADPWVLPADRATYPRVLVHLPYVGYLLRPPVGWLLAGTALATAAWSLLSRGRVRRPRPGRPGRVPAAPPSAGLPVTGRRTLKAV